MTRDIVFDYVEHDLGHKIVKKLGSGVWGAAFLLDDGKVLKYTTCDIELGCALVIFQYKLWKKTPHLPIIYTVESLRDITSGIGSTGGGIIIREHLNDLSLYDIYEDVVGEMPADLVLTLAQLYDDGDELWETEPLEKLWEIDPSEIEYEITTSYMDVVLADVMQELERVGFTPTDATLIDNWGVREDGTIVLRDVTCLFDIAEDD